MKFDVVIIGGGATGLAAAINIKNKKPSLSVCILESLDRVGKKLITTGNGRCNITNRFADTDRYHGASAQFISGVLSRFTVDDTVDFFSAIGVETVFEEDGRAYPLSYQASSVVDCLRFACDEKGVVTLCNSVVTDIVKNDVYTVKCADKTVTARAVIVTGGLLSGGKKVGSDGSVLGIMKKSGLTCVPITPAIVQLKTDTALTRQLKGIKINCDAALYRGSRLLRKEYGEVLFCDYGLSGPPILQLSRNADIGSRIVLDLTPQYDHDALLSIMKKRVTALKDRTAESFLTGFLNKRLGQVVLKACGISLTQSVGGSLPKICQKIKALEFEVVGNTGFINSQVSAGGISESELTADLQCKKYPKMFIAGEIINVDGDCGGFNLQWAWASAAVAADGVIKCL